MTVYGVDIHARYQAGISFTKLRAEGYGFAVMKFTEGTSVSYLSSAKLWIPQIRAAGMLPGGYHWIKAGDGAAQARYFHQHVKAVGGPKGMLIQLDCEDNATQADVTEWVNEWNRLTGRHPFLIYSGGWWWKPRGWTGTKWTPYLWQSHYLSADADTVSDDPVAFAARIPASWWNPGYGGWSQATILQFTSKGDAGSLGNNVDLNIYRGTLAELRALAGIAQSPTAPPPPEGDKMLLIKTKTNATVWRSDGIQRVAMTRPDALTALVNAGHKVVTVDDLGDVEDAAGPLWTPAGEVDTAALLAGILAVLTPQAIAAAIPDVLKREVADELAARLVS